MRHQRVQASNVIEIMSKKSLVIVAMVGAALIVLAFVSGIFQQTDYMSMDYPTVQIPADKVHTLMITTAKHKIVLKGSGGEWRMTEPIESSVEFPPIRSMLRQLEGIELSKAVTQESGRYPDYGVSPDVGRRVEVEWDGGRQRLMVAGQGEEYQGDYVIVGDDPRVFFLTRRLGLNDDPASLRDKRITSIDLESIRSIAVEGTGRDYVVERTDSGAFRFKNGGQIDSMRAAMLFMQYSLLRADDFNDEVKASSVTAKPTITVRVRSGDAESVVYFQDAASFFVAARDDRSTVYQLSAVRMKALAPQRSDLQPN